MNKNENTTFYNYKNNLFSLDDIEASNLSPIKSRKRTDVNSFLFNGEIEQIRKHKSLRWSKKNNIMKPLNITNYNNFKDNRDTSNNNKSYSRIIQKEIILNNNINSPNKKKIRIPTIPINTINNNYYFNIGNNIRNEMKPKNENKIKNIHISLKKINLGNQRVLSKKNISPKNKIKEPFIYKSPRRHISSFTARNYSKHEHSDDINSSYNNYKLLSRINISNKKNNLIPMPNLKQDILRRFNLNNNIIVVNKKIDKKLLDQSQEIKMRFKKENEVIKRKNDFFNKKGVLPEQKIIYENKAIQIQSCFRKFIKKKKIHNYKNGLFNVKICKINEIMINSQSNDNSNNNNYSLINRKYILKYLLIKKEQKRNNILKLFFEKYKNKTINNSNKNNNTNIGNKIYNDIFYLRNQKLRDIIQKKLVRNRIVLFRYFLKYYYNSFYINFNFFLNFINQLTNDKAIDSSNINFIKNKKLFSNDSKELNLKKETNKKKDYLVIHFNDLKETIGKMNNTSSKELKKFYLRDIKRTINKIREEKENIEKEKNLKNFIFILFSKIENISLKAKIEFYYKFIFKTEMKLAKEKNKINYIKIIFQKGQKEILQKNFYKFIRNIIISDYKKNYNKNTQEYAIKDMNKNQINDENRNIQNEINIRINELND